MKIRVNWPALLRPSSATEQTLAQKDKPSSESSKDLVGHYEPTAHNDLDSAKDEHPLVVASEELGVAEDKNKTTWSNIIDMVELVVFTCTYYKPINDIRYQMCACTIKLLKSKGMPYLIVNDSPDQESTKELMINAGATIVQK